MFFLRGRGSGQGGEKTGYNQVELMSRIYTSVFASLSTETHMIFFLSFFFLIRFPDLLPRDKLLPHCSNLPAAASNSWALPQNIPDTSYFFHLTFVALKIWSKFSLLFPTCRRQNQTDKIHKHLQEIISFQQALGHHSCRTKGYQAGHKSETPLSTRWNNGVIQCEKITKSLK